ncbi:MAG: tRNA (adenosine(37)-N6)-threonylcarbamoyltransferase complex dimerization subunit type 1 TsaB [Armatimonadota bacterium]
MKILGIETSGEVAGVALISDGEIVDERTFTARMTLNQRLAPEIAELLHVPAADAGLQAIAAGIGPGSFTGVRMGVAVAKALAHGLGLPLAGISAPEAIVASLGAAPGAGVCVLQKARSDEVYATTLVIEDDGIGRELSATRVLTLPRALRNAEELLERPPDLFAGDAVPELAERIMAAFPDARFADENRSWPTAAWSGLVAAAQPDRLQIEVAFSLTPRYARASQAERQFGVDLGLRG